MATVIVTGSSGFLGHHVVAVLEHLGHKVFPVDRSTSTWSIDITLPSALTQPPMDAKFIVHLAGVLGTSELFGDVNEAIEVNVKGTVNILRMAAMRNAHYIGITMPAIWNNVYQATKTAARILADAWHENEGVPVTHLRAYNLYGPGQKVHGVQKIIPTFAHKAWHGEPIPVWGDGNQFVDLTCAKSVADIIASVIEDTIVDLEDGDGETAYGHGEIIEAGTGQARTVNEVAQAVLDHVDAHIRTTSTIEHLPMRMGENNKPGLIPVADTKSWESTPFILHNLRPHPAFSEHSSGALMLHRCLIETINSYKPALFPHT